MKQRMFNFRKAWFLVAVAAITISSLWNPFTGIPTGAEEPTWQVDPKPPPPTEQPPADSEHGLGYRRPRIDLSHLTGQQMPGGDRRLLSTLSQPPPTFDWRTQGKVTPVKDQGSCGSCYAFAAIANIESRLLIQDNVNYNELSPQDKANYDFSENNAKECNWYETSDTCELPPCDNCYLGGDYFMVTNLFTKKGLVLESCDPYVASDVTCKNTCTPVETLLDWRIICGGTVPDTTVLKNYIQQYGPIYAALFASDKYGFSAYDGSTTFYYNGPEEPNHAVLIVGWDDSLPHAGGNGGWIVKNSWGTEWGDNGYFKIAYGSANIGWDSTFAYAFQDYDENGDIMYYDEGGWSNEVGFGTETVWGLCKFIPQSNTYITHVEFWTYSPTSDIDIYIYDDFNGTTTSNLLAQKLDQSFAEAGYHSVALDSPLAITSGDDVNVVVKFTGSSGEYKIVYDIEGPHEANRSYISQNGAVPWIDTSTSPQLPVDVRGELGIRLRYIIPLDRVEVSPSRAYVQTSAQQQFTATGYDQLNNPIAGLSFNWSVINDGGNIDASGLFTAGGTRGTFSNTAQAEASFGGSTKQDTASVLVGADLTMTATLQGDGRPEAGMDVPLTLKLYDQPVTFINITTLSPIETFTSASGDIVITDKNTGTKVITCIAGGLPTGTYNLTLYTPHCLVNYRADVAIASTGTTVNMGELLEGDAVDITSGSTSVDITDFATFAGAYEASPSSGNWNTASDFDRDEYIGIVDFSMLYTNYGGISPQTVGGP